MTAIEQIREKYFRNQYVNLVSKPEDYYKTLTEQDLKIIKDNPPHNGKTAEFDFKLTTFAYDPINKWMTQYFTDVSIFSLCHELGHFVTVSQEDCMKPALALPFVTPDSDPEWIENFAIPMETGAFVYESILAPIYDPEYNIKTRYFTFNAVLNMSKYFKSKYGYGHALHELHPSIQARFDKIKEGATLEKFDELWFGRNNFYMKNPILPNTCSTFCEV